MRKLVLYTLMSLDGAVDEPGRYFMPRQAGHPPAFDEMMEANEADIVSSQDAVLLGRNMYDEWAPYWPNTEGEAFAEFINPVKKYVVTSRPLTRTWSNSEAVAGPVETLVAELKGQPGGDIGVHGSITLARSLLSAGLVDEIRLVVGPGFGFSGRRLFPDGDEISRLALLSATPTPSGSLLLAYRVT